MQEVLRRPDGVQERARIGSRGLRGSQEHRWVTVGPEAQLEMEEWLNNHTRTGDRRGTSSSPARAWYRGAKSSSSVGGRGQTKMMPPAEATSGPREDKRVRIVTLVLI
jgi:hypothetical protein